MSPPAHIHTLFAGQVVNVHIPMDLSMLRRLIRKRQAVLINLERAIAEKGIRGEEQYHYTGEKHRIRVTHVLGSFCVILY